MKEISQQLLYQRLRNRVIELFEMHSSLEDMATLGAFEMVNMVDDWLPLGYDEAPNVFSEKEKAVVAEFMELADRAADATDENTWKVEWFKNSEQWVRLSEFAQQALVTFSERGCFSEEYEEVLTM
ncbi:MAG: hypothetical protein ABJM43_10285 [Paracoccaceae bacterium]